MAISVLLRISLTTQKTRMLDIITGFDGILFIGDLHTASRRVGRRTDNYGAAILSKLRQSAQISKERNLFPVFLGDVFHYSDENSLELLAGLMAGLREFLTEPVVVGGSHDRKESWLTDKDALKLIASTGLLKVMDVPGRALTLDCKGVLVDLWMTPAGFPVPTAVDRLPGARGIMVTHHDFDFCGMYPDANELHEIEGCEMLVNGHMHKTTPMVLRGATACHNPGSLARVKIDERSHKPRVSAWTPSHGVSLECIYLDVAPAEAVFDMTGKEVWAASPAELKASMPKGQRLSSFAARLRATESLEAGRTDDGSVMVEEMADYFKLFDKPVVLRGYMTDLLQQVLTEQGRI